MYTKAKKGQVVGVSTKESTSTRQDLSGLCDVVLPLRRGCRHMVA